MTEPTEVHPCQRCQGRIYVRGDVRVPGGAQSFNECDDRLHTCSEFNPATGLLWGAVCEV